MHNTDFNKSCLHNKHVSMYIIMQLYSVQTSWLIELALYIPLNTKYVISEMLFPANLLTGTEKTKRKLETASIAEPLQNRQHAHNR